jgi:Domain of unknown function (DUF4167)
MRPGQTGRPHGRNNGNNPYRNRQQIPHRSQTFDSNGPNVKIRGTPYQIFERYVALAREASPSGDRVAAENLYQHAEHYFRVMNAADEGHQHRATRPTAPADLETEMAEGDGPRWLVRRAPHQAISSLIRSDLSFGADSLPEDLPFAPLVREARITRPAWANHSPDTHIRQGAAGPAWPRFVKDLTLCARRSRATTACGAAVPAGGSNASPGRTRPR